MSIPLANAHVLVTGVTGFVGQAILEKLLSRYPSTTISVLVRPRGALSGTQRVGKLLRKPVFASWRDEVGAEEAQAQFDRRVRVLEGDLAQVPPLPSDLDVVIHSASSVSFDMPIDQAFTDNVAGPQHLYQALLESGADPHVVHVSTCYVAGMRKGLSLEQSLEHTVDVTTELTYAYAARANAESASRRSDVLGPLVDSARRDHRRAGAVVVAEAAEKARGEWVEEQLKEAGRTRAQSLGWPDVYTFTKAMGERVAETLWGTEHRLTIVRPTIIESSLHHPYPGWIDGFKVADPLIAAYGRGLLPEFPALADTILDVIPVDFVVNAALVAAEQRTDPGDVHYYQVGSGATEPLRFGRLVRLVGEYFTKHPLKDDEGSLISVPNWDFPSGPVVERSLQRRETLVRAADTLIGRLPATDQTRSLMSKLFKAQRDLRTLRKFTDLYQPYTQTEVIFDDTATRALHSALPPERRQADGFDVTEIDWSTYLKETHIPNVPGLTRARDHKATAPAGLRELPQRRDVLAIFDLHGTVAAANLLEQYVWVEVAAGRPGQALGKLSRLVSDAPRYIQAEMRDRGDFIRTFMRRYAGVNEVELRQAIARDVTPLLKQRVHAEALKRITEHRRAGHRTILVTGQIDVFVESLRPLFDVIQAGEMEKDDAGRWTGHLATSPLVDEARGAWLRRYAEAEGLSLADSYGYGDTYADRPWLELVGYPTVINPDAALYRFAKSRRWPIQTWHETRVGRFAGMVKSVESLR